MKRGSSVRLIGWPSGLVGASSTSVIALLPALRADAGGGRSGRAFAHRDCGGLHGRDDVVVAGTSADIPFERMTDGRLVGVAVAGQEVRRDHDHAGGTEPALEAVLLPERRLERMERLAARH